MDSGFGGEAEIDELLDESFHEEGIALVDVGDHCLGEGPVVRRVGDVVALGGGAGIDPKRRIDPDGLRVLLLLGFDAEDALHLEVGDVDAVELHAAEGRSRLAAMRTHDTAPLRRGLDRHTRWPPPSMRTISPVMKSFSTRASTALATGSVPPTRPSGSREARRAA